MDCGTIYAAEIYLATELCNAQARTNRNLHLPSDIVHAFVINIFFETVQLNFSCMLSFSLGVPNVPQKCKDQDRPTT